MAELFSVSVREKMGTFHQRIDGNRKFTSDGNFDESAIIAYAQHGTLSGTSEVACNEIKFRSQATPCSWQVFGWRSAPVLGFLLRKLINFVTPAQAGA
jgi:hypothetical protein